MKGKKYDEICAGAKELIAWDMICPGISHLLVTTKTASVTIDCQPVI
jgi:hypothetical protein